MATVATGGKRLVVVAATSRAMQQGPVEVVRSRLDRLQAVMSEWVEWMRQDDTRVGFPSHSAALRGAAGDTYERAGSERAALIDVAVSNLEPIYRAAILKRYGMCAAWRFPRGNYDEVLAAAHEVLIAGLRKKGIDIDP